MRIIIKQLKTLIREAVESSTALNPGDYIVYEIYKSESRLGYVVRMSTMPNSVVIHTFASRYCESETLTVLTTEIRKASRADFEKFNYKIPSDFID